MQSNGVFSTLGRRLQQATTPAFDLTTSLNSIFNLKFPDIMSHDSCVDPIPQAVGDFKQVPTAP